MFQVFFQIRSLDNNSSILPPEFFLHIEYFSLQHISIISHTFLQPILLLVDLIHLHPHHLPYLGALLATVINPCI